jgi:polycystin 1L2
LKQKDSCYVYSEILKNKTNFCTNDLYYPSQDLNSYGFGWSQFNSSYSPPNGYQSIYKAFQYQSAEALQGSPAQGKYSTYDGSGYLYEMRGQLRFVQGNLTLLREMNWVDRQTRAIFAEFSVYNPNINLVMVSTILVEFLSSGSILTTAKFDPLNLFGLSSLGGIYALVEHLAILVFMLYILYFMIVELRSMLKRGLKEYFCDFWSFIEWSIIITAWISFAMFIVRLETANKVLSFFKQTGGYGYIKLQTVNNCNQILTFSLGLCSSLGTIKFLKILRFNRSISHLGQTLKICFGELTTFSCIFFVVWIAFVQLMHLIYGPHIEGYATLLKSAETAFQIMLGKINTSDAMMSNPHLTPFLIAAYNMAIIYFSLNIFVSIIIEAFDKVRAAEEENPNEFDFYTHVTHKFNGLFRKNSPSENLPKPYEYKDHLNILPRRINYLINYVLRVKKISPNIKNVNFI